MTYEIDGARQQFVELDDVTLSVYDAGERTDGRPPILFSHGFPELAYTWRHQLRALADAGYWAIAPDQRGYGGSSRPDAVTDYDIFHLTGDLVALMDRLEIDQAIVVGHDWGGFVSWHMPLLHRNRVAGAVGLNTPYVPRFPLPPTELFRMAGGDNHYIVWFQQPEVPDAALDAHASELLERLLRRAIDPELIREAGAAAGDVTFVEAILHAPVLGEPMLTDEELAVYVDAFTRNGFTGPVNWYRNFDRNWELTPELDGAHIDGLPCLMVTASWDPVLVPAMAQGMPEVIDDLEMHEIPECGHWTQQEKPAELNALFLDWLQRRFG